MVGYIKQLTQALLWRFRNPDNANKLALEIDALAEEVNRLDPREFTVGSQAEFVNTRLDLRVMAKFNHTYWAELFHDWHQAKQDNKVSFFEHYQNHPNNLERLGRILDQYAGMGGKATRSLAFVQNPEVRAIVERDYKELVLVLVPGFAWKSAVVIAGSILEAVLYDLLTRDAAQIAKTMASPKAPKKNRGTDVKDIQNDTAEDKWALVDFINVSVDLHLLTRERGQVIDQALRDYRNFIHPRREIKAAHACNEAEATLAKGALDAVCNDLSVTPGAGTP